jgi:hypothetical protein
MEEKTLQLHMCSDQCWELWNKDIYSSTPVSQIVLTPNTEQSAALQTWQPLIATRLCFDLVGQRSWMVCQRGVTLQGEGHPRGGGEVPSHSCRPQ